MLDWSSSSSTVNYDPLFFHSWTGDYFLGVVRKTAQPHMQLVGQKWKIFFVLSFKQMQKFGQIRYFCCGTQNRLLKSLENKSFRRFMLFRIKKKKTKILNKLRKWIGSTESVQWGTLHKNLCSRNFDSKNNVGTGDDSLDCPREIRYQLVYLVQTSDSVKVFFSYFKHDSINFKVAVAVIYSSFFHKIPVSFPFSNPLNKKTIFFRKCLYVLGHF